MLPIYADSQVGGTFSCLHLSLVLPIYADSQVRRGGGGQLSSEACYPIQVREGGREGGRREGGRREGGRREGEGGDYQLSSFKSCVT